MKVSHHGSADPGLPEVLDRLRPGIAGIEVGAHNTTATRRPRPWRRWPRRRRDLPTDQDGTVTLTVTHGAMRVTTER